MAALKTEFLNTHTPMNNVARMKVVDGFKNLFDCLRGILLGEPSLVADPVEQLAAGG